MNLIKSWMNVFMISTPVEFFGIIEVINLLLYIFIKSFPLFFVIIGWELPKDLLQVLAKNRITEFENIHGHQEDVDKVISEGPNLLPINTYSEHITEH